MDIFNNLDILITFHLCFRLWWFELTCAIVLSVVLIVRQLAQKQNSKNSAQSSTKGADEKDLDDVSEDKEIQKQIHKLFDQANSESPHVFELYDSMTHQRGINFKDYIREQRHAQALFLALLTHAIRTKNDAKISNLIKDMDNMGVQRNLCFYATLMKCYTSRGRCSEAMNMYQRMIKDGVEPDAQMYICLMNDAIAINNSERCIFFFEKLSSIETPSMRTFMTIIRMHAKDQNWVAASKLLSDMKNIKVNPDNLVFNNILGVCVTAGQSRLARQLLEDWSDVPGVLDIISYNTVLKGYAQVADLTKSEALLEQMLNHGPEPNLITFNTVMDCSVRSMQKNSRPVPRRRDTRGESSPSAADQDKYEVTQSMANKPWEILDVMEARGLVPDRYTCSTLIKGMHLSSCTVTEIDRAIGLLKRLGPGAFHSPDTDNTRLHEVLFNSMLDACVNARDLNRMAEVFELMRDCRVPVSAVTFGTLIKAFGQVGKLDRCKHVWAEMRRAGVRPTAVTYGCYIDSCIRNDEAEHAMEVFHEMGPDGIDANTVIYTTLVKGFARLKQPKQALELYSEMKQKGIRCSQMTFNSVLDVITRHVQDSDLLNTVLEDMKSADVQPDVVTYSILIKAACAAGNLDNAMSIFEKLKREGLVLDEIAFNSLLMGCSKNQQLEHATRVFESMRSLGVQPSNVTFSILIKMYGRAKMLDKALSLLDLMETEYKAQPNLHVYTCLIQACVQNTQVKRGWDLFHRMSENGVAPDAVTFGTLIHGCVYANKFVLALELVFKAYGKDENGNRVEGLPVVRLQSEVMNSLLAALVRKSKHEMASQLEKLMAEDGVSINQKLRRRGIGTSVTVATS